jgi:hypothetical protein
MNLVYDTVDGPMVRFKDLRGITRGRTTAPGGGTIEGQGTSDLTGPSGRAIQCVAVHRILGRFLGWRSGRNISN